MRFNRATWATFACLFFGAVLLLAGQTAVRPYGIRGPRPTAEQAARSERLYAILAEGWKVTPAEAERLETELSHNPDNLPVQIRLISYYTQYVLDEPRARHLIWLIETHPDADVFRDAETITRISSHDRPADYARAKALWLQQANRFATNTKVLSNAAMALAGEPEIALQLVKAARNADPAKMEWTRWLAKIDADAIRWSFWDGKSMMTFTGDAEDFRRYPFFLPPSMYDGVKSELETSTDAALVEAVGEAMVREVRLLRETSGQRPDGPSSLTPELPQVAEFGEMLLGRARGLEPNRSKTPK